MMDLEETVSRCKRGDEAAWKALVDALAPRFYRLCLGFAPSAAEAEELTQEVFLKIWQNLHKYDEGSNFTGWAMKLARNLLIDAFRKTRTERKHAFTDEQVLAMLPSGDNPEQDAERRQRLRIVARALKRIDEEFARLVLMRDFAGLSYNEIASTLDLPLGTVKSRLNRARIALAREVQKIAGLRAVGAAR